MANSSTPPWQWHRPHQLKPTRWTWYRPNQPPLARDPSTMTAISLIDAMHGHQPSVEHFGIVKVVRDKAAFGFPLSYDEKKIWIRMMVDKYLPKLLNEDDEETLNDDFLLDSDSDEMTDSVEQIDNK